MLLLGLKGDGKTAVAAEFAKALGYDTAPFALFGEMSSRDLLMRRTIDPATGDTRWEESPLLNAARTGRICLTLA